jgi:hypothetical protein
MEISTYRGIILEGKGRCSRRQSARAELNEMPRTGWAAERQGRVETGRRIHGV